MDQMMTAPKPVNMSAPKARRKAAPPAAGTPTPKDGKKRVRKDGRVASTILLSQQVDDWLSTLAHVKQEDRSTLAAEFIRQGLARHTSLADDLMAAAERFKRLAAAKSDDSTHRPDGGADSTREDIAA